MPPHVEPGASATERALPRRILVVDDNVDAADCLAMLLEFDGHEVHAVYGAIEALEAVERLKPEVMFLDIGLPVMDGYEVARRLKARHSQIPLRLIALTGYGQRKIENGRWRRV